MPFPWDVPESGHVRRTAPFALLVLAGLLLLPTAAGARSQASYRSSTERTVFVLLNDIRREHKLTPFTFSTALRASAREHSADMLARQYFEHDSPDEAFDHRIRRHLDSSLVGENIAWGTGALRDAAGARQALDAVADAPPHHPHARPASRRPGRRDRLVRRQQQRRDGDRRLRCLRPHALASAAVEAGGLHG